MTKTVTAKLISSAFQYLHYFAAVVVYCLVAQSCPTLCDPMDCSLPV